MSESLAVIVSQRGWVMIGYVSRDGDHWRLRAARTIIVWGTTGLGLEHLAAVGPTPNTKFSAKTATDRFHVLSVIRNLECTPEAVIAWEKSWEKK